jgi:hypothetical protein
MAPDRFPRLQDGDIVDILAPYSMTTDWSELIEIR